jgi:hypothetical protein
MSDLVYRRPRSNKEELKLNLHRFKKNFAGQIKNVKWHKQKLEETLYYQD